MALIHASRRKPQIFIISSSKAARVRDAIASQLSDVATTVPWNQQGLWKPGSHFLDDLLQKRDQFDFAVAIFSPDDEITIDKNVKAYQPRDNVVFETGLFMGALGPQRTIVIAPDTAPLKWASDLAGLTILRFSSSARSSTLNIELRNTCEALREIIARHSTSPGAVHIGPSGYTEGLQTVRALMAEKSNHRTGIHIKNIALDMEHTWGFVREELLKTDSHLQASWQSLMIDPQAVPHTQSLEYRYAVERAAESEKRIKTFFHSSSYRETSRARFSCRAYSATPTLHGFLVDRHTLFLNLCVPKDNDVMSSGYYLRFKNTPANKLASGYIGLFADWFDLLWANSRPVWPETDEPEEAAR